MIELVSTNSIVIAACTAALILLGLLLHTLEIRRSNKNEIKYWKEKYDKTLSQKKSSEVRLGKTAEHLAPFTHGWQYDPERFVFIGCPVDGISFNEDSIVFVEIKTGKARLTKSQKHAKQLIKDGKVRFETFRVSEDGVSIHKEEIIKYGTEVQP